MSYSASQQASTRSSSVHLLYLFLKQLSIVLYLIKAFLFAGIVFSSLRGKTKIVGISLGKDVPTITLFLFLSYGNSMMLGRKNYILDDVVILYRMCMVYQMDAAHNMSVRSVAGPERQLDLLCSLSRPYCIGFSKSAAKIRNKNEIFLRRCGKVKNLEKNKTSMRKIS